MKRTDLAGRDLTKNLQEQLLKDGNNLINLADQEIVRCTKEKLCYVTMDFEQELSASARCSGQENSYELPDGQVITIGNKCFRCPELLFQPSFVGLEAKGIHKQILDSILECDKNIWKDISNVILSGGSTLFPGFTERLEKEPKSDPPSNMKVKITSSTAHDRKYLAWKGGSILGSLSTFEQMCITKQEYDENGPTIAHKKCS